MEGSASGSMHRVRRKGSETLSLCQHNVQIAFIVKTIPARKHMRLSLIGGRIRQPHFIILNVAFTLIQGPTSGGTNDLTARHQMNQAQRIHRALIGHCWIYPVIRLERAFVWGNPGYLMTFTNVVILRKPCPLHDCQ